MGILRHGVAHSLEAEADELIRKSLEGVTAHSAKADILTPWKQQDRLSREVYSSTGVPDSSLRQGMWGRAWNRDSPHLNSRDGVARVSRIDGTLREFVDDNQPRGASETFGRSMGDDQ